MTADPTWWPIASSTDLVLRHVMQGQLHGDELAIWRADDGHVNVWENRCLHRGVRLSIGINTGAELVCQYHGWRYANRSAGCTYIPAHPADAPAQTICATTFPAVERYGLVFTGDEGGEPAAITSLEGGHLTLRPLPVNASIEQTAAALAHHRCNPVDDLDAPTAEYTTSAKPGVVTHTASTPTSTSTVVFFLQPVATNRCVIRPVLVGAVDEDQQMPVLRHHATALARSVDRIERAVEDHHGTETRVAVRSTNRSRTNALTVAVTAKESIAPEIVSIRLEATDDELPAAQPGAHIDLHLPGGLTRQYSLTNGPNDTDHYQIAVRRDPQSTGGSATIHDEVVVGTELRISAPRNGFPLRRDAQQTIFIAGGIGITPLVAMAKALDHNRRAFAFHLFARSARDAAHHDTIEALSGDLTPHLGLTAAQTNSTIAEILAEPSATTQVYVCGPPPMLDSVRRLAAELGWPDHAVHFEYFRNGTDLDTSSEFEVRLARTGQTIAVPTGTTLLEQLRASGIDLDSSCEQGACRTCIVTVLEGDPDHQDVCLTADEREGGSVIATCVS